MPVALSGGQLTRTVTSQLFAVRSAIVVVTLNCASPGCADGWPLAKTEVGPVVPVVTALQGFMIKTSCVISVSYNIPDARPK